MKTPSRFLALWLVLALGCPSPALALRAVGLEESNQQPVLRETLEGAPTRQHQAGLEENAPTPITESAISFFDELAKAVVSPTPNPRPFPKIVTDQFEQNPDARRWLTAPDVFYLLTGNRRAIPKLSREAKSLLAWSDAVVVAFTTLLREKDHPTLMEVYDEFSSYLPPTMATYRGIPPFSERLYYVPEETAVLAMIRRVDELVARPPAASTPPIAEELARRPRQHQAGLEEDPITAALKATGVAAVEVNANGAARLNGQVIATPAELQQPGFFAPGSRTIVARIPESPVFALELLWDQIGIPGARKAFMDQDVSPFPGAVYRDQTGGTLDRLHADVEYATGQGEYVAIVARASWLPQEQATALLAGRADLCTVIGVPDDYQMTPNMLLPMILAARAQGGVLYLSATRVTTYRNDRVLLIAA